jgi:RNA polymerase sigma factor (sigma-70 family)
LAGAGSLIHNLGMPDKLDFESLVSRFYAPLYQFAFGLSGMEADASDLTQQTFYIWATKGHQLRDDSKVKTWLFTTLHREFLNSRRKIVRFPHQELEQVESELPVIAPGMANAVDAGRVVELLREVGEPYQAALVLFYLEECSYKEISLILEVPLGTVQSRISRGVAQLQQLMLKGGGSAQAKELHG